MLKGLTNQLDLSCRLAVAKILIRAEQNNVANSQSLAMQMHQPMEVEFTIG